MKLQHRLCLKDVRFHPGIPGAARAPAIARDCPLDSPRFPGIAPRDSPRFPPGLPLEGSYGLKDVLLHMEHPGKALPEGAAGIGFAFGTSGLKAFAASGAASPVRRPCPAIAPRLDFVFKGPYSPAIAFFPRRRCLVYPAKENGL